MTHYIALLRGINVGGKNKISMSELKSALADNGFKDVMSYINSGNIIFKSENSDKHILIEEVEKTIKDRFDLDIPVTILTETELSEVINNSPEWWGHSSKEIYHSTIFMIPPMDAQQVFSFFGAANQSIEQVQVIDQVIYWSANLASYQKSKWSKIASSSMNEYVTVRTANTVKKIKTLIEKNNA